jgi:hypothetical protein
MTGDEVMRDGARKRWSHFIRNRTITSKERELKGKETMSKQHRRGRRPLVLLLFLFSLLLSISQIYFMVTRSEVESYPEDGYDSRDLLASHGSNYTDDPHYAALHNESTEKNTATEVYESPAVDKWENSTVLPRWMQEYFDFHKETRSTLDENNWKNHNYLVIRCLDIDDRCGGASDRLQPLPAIVKLASKTNRLLLIKWNRPAALEEFLVPPLGGIDWTVPDFLDHNFNYSTSEPMRSELKQSESLLLKRGKFRKQRLQTIRFQTHTNDHGAGYYNTGNAAEDLPFDRVFRAVWDAFFTPAKPVATLIDQQMTDLSLAPGKYVSSHVRSRYKRDKSKTTSQVENAVNCASLLKPGHPVYFASDSTASTHSALHYGRQINATVVARTTDTEPLHLDRGSEFLKRSQRWNEHNASAYYDVFVDLYLLANSACVAHGVGGYGKWGSLLSHNRECRSDHQRTECNFTSIV